MVTALLKNFIFRWFDLMLALLIGDDDELDNDESKEAG